MDDKYRYRNTKNWCIFMFNFITFADLQNCLQNFYLECWISNKHVEFKWIFLETIISKTVLRTHDISSQYTCLNCLIMTMRATVTYTRTRPCNISPERSCTESKDHRNSREWRPAQFLRCSPEHGALSVEWFCKAKSKAWMNVWKD